MASRFSKAYRSKEGAASKSAVYTDVCEAQPSSYSDYEALSVQWGDQDNYEVVRKVGRGKYSEASHKSLISLQLPMLHPMHVSKGAAHAHPMHVS